MDRERHLTLLARQAAYQDSITTMREFGPRHPCGPELIAREYLIHWTLLYAQIVGRNEAHSMFCEFARQMRPDPPGPPRLVINNTVPENQHRGDAA